MANVLFTNELAKKLEGTGVTAVCLHPGAVRTDLMRYTGEGLNRLVPIIVSIGYPLYWIVSKSSYEGSQTSVHCAVDDSIPDLHGKYFRLNFKTINNIQLGNLVMFLIFK